MVVRFQPQGGDASVSRQSDRGNLAEVIELRTRLTSLGEGGAPRREPAGELVAFPGAAVSVPIEQVRAQMAELEHADTGDAHRLAAAEPRSAAADAVRLLARRARSSGELRRELAALGHDATEIESVVLDCEGSLYLDDLGLARVLTEGLRERKRASRAQIRMKLRERQLPDGVIEQALGELDDDEEYELLRQAANDRARKMGGIDRQTAERRLLGFLARRGWSGERAVRVAREALDNTAARGNVRFR